MPKVTVYVRNEDYSKWRAIEEKTEFLHNALHQEIPEIFPVDRVKTFQPINADTQVSLCKHGKPLTFCKFAKPGKPCR